MWRLVIYFDNGDYFAYVIHSWSKYFVLRHLVMDKIQFHQGFPIPL